MKFQTEKKKPTLCIYTDEDYSTEKLEWEVRTLRQELEGTRAALRLQAARCRHLVAAFGSQIRRSEVAARRERELRDEQLSRLLRALLVLDAGLRREQRNIREQLRAKDSVIHAQQLEIAMLKGEDEEEFKTTYRSPVRESEDIFGEVTRIQSDEERHANENSRVNGEVYRSVSQLKASKSNTCFVKFKKNNQKVTNKKILKPSVSFEDQLPHRHEGLEELQRMANGIKEEIVEISNDDGYIEQEEEQLNRNLYEDYQHNPVLECVNQILLRDFEDEDMEADKENYQSRPIISKGRDILEVVNNNVDKDDNRKWPLKDKIPSPPIKAQHLEEKACLMMSSQRMTLVRNVDFEEVDKNTEDGVTIVKRELPPALPPKPKQLQLGSRGKKTIITQHKPSGQPNGHEFITPLHDKPPQRKILSNGSLKYPLNLDPNKDQKNTSKTFEEKIDDMNITLLHHNTPRGIAVMSATDKVDDTKNGKIKVGSSVSFLITGATRDSIVNELSQGELPKVSNMVRRFEDLGTCKEEDEEEKGNEQLRENFEEFKLEDVDMDAVDDQEGRPAGDGEETKNEGTYENFLEATGLSQKSIMTPSRMFNNHRSVLKPKDVKHRSKLLKAAAITNQGGNIVKYWTEPFL